MAAFPPLETPSHDGWGPVALPTKFSELPFATFSKGERLGRIADWIQGPTQFGGRYQRDRNPPVQGPFTFRTNEEEDTFQLVDTKTQQQNQKPKGFVQLRPRYAARGRGGASQGRGRGRGRHNAGDEGHGSSNLPRESSVPIHSTWEELEQFPFSALNKLSTEPPEPVDIQEMGKVPFYDKGFDRITSKTEKRLQKIENTPTFPPSASDDPVLCSLASSGKGQVFATDAVLAAVMAAPRSVFSWDVVITKADGKIFLDKRAGSRFDNFTVNETSVNPPPEDKEGNIDGHPSLSLEATFINHNFALQVTTQQRPKSFIHLGTTESPFEDSSKAGGVRYRLFELEEGGLKIVVRCSVDAAVKVKDKDELLMVRALNEYDPKSSGVDWRKQLDSQRGAVFATEIRNNNGKIARWCAASLLGGVDQIKIGYISRVAPRDPYNHTILGTQFYKPFELATQMALTQNNMWAIVKRIVDVVSQYEDGKFVLVKDALKPLLTLYAVPSNAFDEDN
eukprot:c11244_g1_i1.p1 GENE.c11244_g1_i1~~c11244_g1_i1.p1  ORF type:complete len:526 (-),score=155.81 c11244_g1_i1:162-1682(-)